MSPASAGWSRHHLADAVLLLGLAALALKATYAVPAARDAERGDEWFYLREGLAIPEAGMPAAHVGPLYCLWYCALAKVSAADPMDLPHLSWAALTVLLPAGVFVL